MDDESWEVLGKVTNSPKLINKFKDKVKENKVEEEEGNVCKALQEFYDDGVAEGEAKGEAKKLVENINNLINNLGISLQDACQAIGSSVQNYEDAKKLLKK